VDEHFRPNPNEKKYHCEAVILQRLNVHAAPAEAIYFTNT